MELDWDIVGRLNDLPPQDKIDTLHDLLTIGELPDSIRKDLQVILSNHIITEYLNTKYPIVPEVKEKRKRAPRVKKPVADVPVVE